MSYFNSKSWFKNNLIDFEKINFNIKCDVDTKINIPNEAHNNNRMVVYNETATTDIFFFDLSELLEWASDTPIGKKMKESIRNGGSTIIMVDKSCIHFFQELVQVILFQKKMFNANSNRNGNFMIEHSTNRIELLD